MNSRYTRIFVFFVIGFVIFKTFRYFLTDNTEYPEELYNKDGLKKVKISVYYEALCPDSRYFMTNQLLQTYINFKNYLILDLVPYGKAQTLEIDGKIEFQCQHEAVECLANKVHACAIEFIKDPWLLLKYNTCMISDNVLPIDVAEKCGQELDVDSTPIVQCAKTNRGSRLLKMYGERTNSLSPAVQFIPTIELDNNQNLIPQSAILKDLTKSICKVFKNELTICD